MVYVDRMHKTLTRRAGDWLSRNSRPRLLVLWSYGLAALVAYRSSVSLAALGIIDVATRFSICFLIAYVTYAFVIGIWLTRMPTIHQQTLMRGAPREIETRCPSDGCPEWLEQVVDGALASIRRDSRSVLVLVMCLAILGVVFLLTHWMIYARWYLGELMVLAGKVQHRSVRRVAHDAWVTEPFRQSFWMAFGLLLHFALIGTLVTLKLA